MIFKNTSVSYSPSSSVTQKTGRLGGLNPTSLKAFTLTLMLVAGGRASRFFSKLVVFTSHELPDGGQHTP